MAYKTLDSLAPMEISGHVSHYSPHFTLQLSRFSF